MACRCYGKGLLMAIQVTTNTRIQIMITVTDDDGILFTDALYYPLGQIPTNPILRTEAINRYRAWRTVRDIPRPSMTRGQRQVAIQERRESMAREATAIAAEEIAILLEGN